LVGASVLLGERHPGYEKPTYGGVVIEGEVGLHRFDAHVEEPRGGSYADKRLKCIWYRAIFSLAASVFVQLRFCSHGNASFLVSPFD
jgi:hypothetical protein